MSKYLSLPRCDGCGRRTKTSNKSCPLGDDCTAPVECHARIGIGVATSLSCSYPKNHDGLHSYGFAYCNTHLYARCPRGESS